MPSTNNPQEVAAILQNNTVPDGQDTVDSSDDAISGDMEAVPTSGKPYRRAKGHPIFDYPRNTEIDSIAAPKRSDLRISESPKRLNGKRLTRVTLGRDRDMLNS